MAKCSFDCDNDSAFLIIPADNSTPSDYCLGHFIEFAVELMRTVESSLADDQRAEVDKTVEGITKRGSGPRARSRRHQLPVAVGDNARRPEVVEAPPDQAPTE
jgi:hypothetical protein